LIFQSGSTVPQFEQDQMILGIDTPQLLNTFELYSTGEGLPAGLKQFFLSNKSRCRKGFGRF
jgi:hypothetical protein